MFMHTLSHFFWLPLSKPFCVLLPAGTPDTLGVARGLPPAADLDPFGVPDEMQDAFDMQQDIVKDVSQHCAGACWLLQ